MEIDIKIKGTKSEIASILDGLLENKNIATALGSKDAYVEEEPNEEGYVDVLDIVSWETFHLVNFTYKQGEKLKGTDLICCEYDDIEEYLNITDRQIGARVGGLKKVSERLGIEEMLTITRKNGKKYCCVKTNIKAALEHCCEDWQYNYESYLEENDLSDPSELLIV